MRKFLTGLVIYDYWFLQSVESILSWLEEWLSIKQRNLEWVLIATFVATIVDSPYRFHPLWFWDVLVTLLITELMVLQTSSPAAIRAVFRYRLFSVRLLIHFILFLSLAGAWIPPRHLVDAVLKPAVYLFFEYTICVNSSGNYGSRRKRAWAWWKELFDTRWLPAPQLPIHVTFFDFCGGVNAVSKARR